LEDLDAEVEIDSACETIPESINVPAKEGVGYCESRRHKLQLDEGCSNLSDQREHAKLQLLRDSREINMDNLNSVRGAVSIHFRNKKGNI
jgi:hypothetical protein